MRIRTTSHAETQQVAKLLAQYIQPGMVIRLDGPLGAGKTTFTQGFAQGLGITRRVNSPTYTIVKQYPIPDKNFELIHMDAYRLEQGGAESLDIDAVLSPDAITFIEWAQFIEGYLPEDYLMIQLNPMDSTTREITIKPCGNSLKYDNVIAMIEDAVEERGLI